MIYRTKKRENLIGKVVKKFWDKEYNNQNDLLVIGSLKMDDMTIAKHVNTLSHLHRAMRGFHDIQVDAKASPFDAINNLHEKYRLEQEQGIFNTKELVISLDAHGAMTDQYAKGEVHTILGFEKGYTLPQAFAKEASKISDDFGINVTILINTCRNILSGDEKKVSAKLEHGASENVTIVFSSPPNQPSTNLAKDLNGKKHTLGYVVAAVDALREINPNRLVNPSDLKSSLFGSLNKVLNGRLYSPTQVLNHNGNYIEVPLELSSNERYQVLAAALEKHLANQR